MQLPFFREIESSRTVLLAGAGGGFDIFAALPLYFALRQAGKTVYLANLSFSQLYASTGKRIGRALVEVTAQTQATLRYFPELHLARWFKEQGEDITLYAFDRTGVRPLQEGYRYLVKQLQPDTLILIDGGTDSLMRGDEPELGTPEEDMASLAAVDTLDIAKKMLVCIGFGVDTFHGVSHAYYLEAVADITRQGGYLGAWSLTPEMPEVKFYREACDAVHAEMFNNPSIVNCSILSAVEGHFGNYHATYRTEGSKLFINPLMSLYWAFRLEAVVNRNLYLDRVRETETYQDICTAIIRYRAENQPHREWVSLPM